jgi:hypothetical protein
VTSGWGDDKREADGDWLGHQGQDPFNFRVIDMLRRIDWRKWFAYTVGFGAGFKAGRITRGRK